MRERRIKRLTRVRKEWVIREEGFSCKKCGAGNDDILWNEEEKVLYCKKCKHELTEREELEEQIAFKEIQEYGFWLRFVKEHFNPCDKCQDRLHRMLYRSGTWYINNDNMGVDLAIFGDHCYFSIRWMAKAVYFTPCPECAEKLKELVRYNNLCIGNKDTEPAVELWRKWAVIDESEDK